MHKSEKDKYLNLKKNCLIIQMLLMQEKNMADIN